MQKARERALEAARRLEKECGSPPIAPPPSLPPAPTDFTIPGYIRKPLPPLGPPMQGPWWAGGGRTATRVIDATATGARLTACACGAAALGIANPVVLPALVPWLL